MDVDIHGHAALTVAETIILMLIEHQVVSHDNVMCALETLLQHHNRLATVDDGTDAERQANSAIAHVIGNFMRGTNFRAAAPLHAIQHSGESDHR
jgi:hypothetical protein